MSVIFTILVCIFSIGVFIPFVYFKYGARATFNFFFFSFFVASLKEGPMKMNGVWLKNPAMPYEFLKGHSSVIINTFLAMFGWVFTFCLAWFIADKIAARIYSGKKYLFAVLFLAALAAASIGYAVEASAIGIGWWRWTFEDVRMTGYLIGAPFIVLITWAHFPTQYILAPYFLINLSKFRRVSWKGIFFLIPFLHSLTADFKPESVRVTFEYFALAAMAILAFTSRLHFEYQAPENCPRNHFLKRLAQEALPIIIAFMLMSILAFFDLIKARDAKLLISILPLFFMVLLAIQRVPMQAIVMFSILCCIIFGKIAFLAAIPVILSVLLKAKASFDVRRAGKI